MVFTTYEFQWILIMSVSIFNSCWFFEWYIIGKPRKRSHTSLTLQLFAVDVLNLLFYDPFLNLPYGLKLDPLHTKHISFLIVKASLKFIYLYLRKEMGGKIVTYFNRNNSSLYATVNCLYFEDRIVIVQFGSKSLRSL